MNLAQHTPGPLTVAASGDRQFHIKSDYLHREGEWEDIYVSLSGFCGSYGPQLFAAAPDLLHAAKAALFVLTIVNARSPGTNEQGAIEALAAAIAKAEVPA
ncbi:hypothetical protein [Antarcticirhabdus aurantiaca]|uniref:Uncharacterized protein n=1 Tax=Antarcticirhabdus aurantiaca TaxID=2606717 RepID=A0ACD4NJZ0_9HYPH|nr:hypothetical protein [Antarcticirhabdus aurantiaca]WAJ27150.1 hypothetical protein OXU80_20170 [Jeongeuplla avenae]